MKKFLKKFIAIAISLEMCFGNILAVRSEELNVGNYAEAETVTNIDEQQDEIKAEIYAPTEEEKYYVEEEFKDIIAEQRLKVVFEDGKWIFKPISQRTPRWSVIKDTEGEVEIYEKYEKNNIVFKIGFSMLELFEGDSFERYITELDKFVGFQKEFLGISDVDKMEILIDNTSTSLWIDWYGPLRMSQQFFETLLVDKIKNNNFDSFRYYLVRSLHSYYGFKYYNNRNFYDFTLGGYYEPFLASYKNEML